MSKPKPIALIADDDEANRLLLCDAAMQAGCEVLEAADGTQALELGRSREFDLALLDIEMPGLNGFEVCSMLRRQPRTQFKPILMITGRDDAPSIECAFEAGATDFMSKPLNWPLVPHRLAYILRNAMTEQQVRRMAYVDSMTDLPNLQSLKEFATNAIAAAGDAKADHGITLIKIWAANIDRISQSFGRNVANSVIVDFARRLAALQASMGLTESRTLLARTDGARFAICVTENMAPDQAERLAALIIADAESPVSFNEHAFFLRPAIGIARFPEHGATADELVMNADAALQQSLSGVAPAAVTYTPQFGEQSRHLMQLDSELRRAVRDEQLTLVFQPKVRLADGALTGVEALLRWYHPELGQISPAQFVPLAEESGLILDLGDWVVRAAFRQIRNWQDAGFHTSIAVNFAVAQFLHRNPAQTISAAARACALDPRRVVVEVTESAFVRDLPRVKSAIDAVRNMGCRVAVDDFGTGYSSLAHLKTLPIDELKVDRAFIQRIDTDGTDAAIYETILQLADKLRLSVTAEGVETQGQLEWLRSRGCAEAQGFLIAAPMSAHRVIEQFAEAAPASGRQWLSTG